MITEEVALKKINEREKYFLGLCESVDVRIKWMVFPGGHTELCVVEVGLSAVVKGQRNDAGILFVFVEDGAEVHCCKLLAGTPKGGSFGLHDVHVEKRRAHCGDGEYLVMRLKELSQEELFSQNFSFSSDSAGEWLMPLANITGQSSTGQ